MTNNFVRKNSALNEFVSGLKDGLPLQIGVIPFGIVFGIVGLEVGLSPLQTFNVFNLIWRRQPNCIYTITCNSDTICCVGSNSKCGKSASFALRLGDVRIFAASTSKMAPHTWISVNR